MKVILEVVSGPDAPRSFLIDAGEEVHVGRKAPAQILLANDRTLSRLHFALKFDGKHCRLRDLGSSHGTTVNGLAVTECLVTEGDRITAGATGFQIVLSAEMTTDPISSLSGAERMDELAPTVFDSIETQDHDVIPPALHGKVIEFLRSQKEPLFALLDAARDPMVLALLLNCKEKYQSLYEGPKADQMMASAPYLAALPPGSDLLARLVQHGWGKSWGVYLTSKQPFDEVRKHLRRFLTVELEGKKDKVLFRFYDPRVLRVYLPTCTPEELAQFLGPVSLFLMEDASPETVLTYEHRKQGLRQHSISLDSDAAAAPRDPGSR